MHRYLHFKSLSALLLREFDLMHNNLLKGDHFITVNIKKALKIIIINKGLIK